MTSCASELFERQDDAMLDLTVTGVEGTDLHLVDADGGRYRLPIDDQVRESVMTTADAGIPDAVGTDDAVPAADPAQAPDPAQATASPPVPPAVPVGLAAAPPSEVPQLPPGELVTPRTVQELLRAGHTSDQVATAAGWDLAKVQRYAAPIEAERGYIAELAQDLPVAASAGDAAATIGQRVAARLHDRGVSEDAMTWDAHRTAGRGWVVVCRFSAGGRIREASWQFRPATRTLTAIDDESRWLGEDERSGGGPVPPPAPPVKVFDVEAEGGVTEPAQPVDLVTAMQARSRDRRARGSRARRVSTAGAAAGTSPQSEGLLPVPDRGDPDQQQVPQQQPGEVGRADDGTGHSGDGSIDVSPTPTVDDLGHDPATGTVDLFEAVQLTPGEAPDPVETDALDQATLDQAEALDQTEATIQVGADQGFEADPPATVAVPTLSADGGSDADLIDDAADSSPVPPRRPAGSRSGRPSVPSWDDIMFGGRRGRD